MVKENMVKHQKVSKYYENDYITRGTTPLNVFKPSSFKNLKVPST